MTLIEQRHFVPDDILSRLILQFFEPSLEGFDFAGRRSAVGCGATRQRGRPLPSLQVRSNLVQFREHAFFFFIILRPDRSGSLECHVLVQMG